MASLSRITPCLWFDTDGEDAARHYTSIFPNSRINGTTPYSGEGPRAGTTMIVDFELDGQPFQALNGGPQFTFTEAVSFCVSCEDQAEVDHYWERLTEGGEEGPCGWLKDRFGLSWQIVPTVLMDLMNDSDPGRVARVTEVVLGTKGKLDIAEIQRAAAG